MSSVHDLHRRGREASAAGDFERAQSILNQALELATSAEETARITVTLAYVRAELGEVAEAAAMCRDLTESDLPIEVRGLAWSAWGLLHLRAGELVHARECIDRALGMLEQPRELGFAYLNSGTVAMSSGDLARAGIDLRLASSLLASAGEHVDAAKTRHNAAYVSLLKGDVAEAVREMERVRPILSRESAVLAAVCDQDRAEALRAAGMEEAADDALVAAIAAFDKEALRQFQAEAELVRARTLVQRRPELARDIARQARRRFSRRGSEGWALRAQSVALWAEISTGSRSLRSMRTAKELASQLRAVGVVEDAMLADLSVIRLLIRRGQLVEASAKADSIAQPSDIGTRLLLHEIRGDLARARGERTRSLAHVRSGLAELHAWQSTFGSLDLQSSVVSHGRQLAIDGMRMALQDGSPGLVHEWAERGRALAGRVTPVRSPADPALADELAELRRLSTLDQQNAAQREQVAALQSRVREHAWQGVGSGETTEPIGIRDLQDALGEAAEVALITLGGQITGLVVTADDARVVGLGEVAPALEHLDRIRADLDVLASGVLGSLGAQVQASLDRSTAALADQVIAPLLPILGERPVVLTPSSGLARTPWPMLPGLRGRPLCVPRSATAWVAAADLPPIGDRVGLVAGPRVARAGAEVAAVARVRRGAHRLDDEHADVDAVRELAGRSDVLHVAAHGVHSEENPLFSGLELADGTFFGYDIDHLAEVPDLVVLSACELGSASIRAGEETVGMTAAWLHAGARAVIAAPALLSDDVAAELMPRLHALMAGGAGPAEALAAVEPTGPSPLVCYGRGW